MYIFSCRSGRRHFSPKLQRVAVRAERRLEEKHRKHNLSDLLTLQTPLVCFTHRFIEFLVKCDITIQMVKFTLFHQ